jgi:hypothetical protein
VTFTEIMALGFWTDKDGYAICSVNGKMWRRARLVAHELIQPLTEDDAVHHLNHQKQDDRPENLQVMLFSEHCRHHMWGNDYGKACKGRPILWKEKIAAARRGKHYPKLSAALSGRTLPEETRKRISKALTGLPRKPYTCRLCGKVGLNARTHATHQEVQAA